MFCEDTWRVHFLIPSLRKIKCTQPVLIGSWITLKETSGPLDSPGEIPAAVILDTLVGNYGSCNSATPET